MLGHLTQSNVLGDSFSNALLAIFGKASAGSAIANIVLWFLVYSLIEIIKCCRGQVYALRERPINQTQARSA